MMGCFIKNDLPYQAAAFGFAIGCLIGRNIPVAGDQKGNTDNR
jgi:hypothetical protein